MVSATIFFGYMLGSIPFGLIFTKIFGSGDIRESGSGNIGATNVLRSGQKFLALLTLIFDAGKGSVSVLIIGMIEPTFEYALITGIASIIGHNFPIWLKFRGGKGVATSIGVLLAISWPVGITVCGTWLIIAFIFKISSLSAIISFCLAPIYGWYFHNPVQSLPMIIMTTFIAILCIYRHRSNIKRVLNGSESKIGGKI